MTVREILKGLFDCYPASKANEGTVLGYLKHFQGIPLNELQAAIDQAIEECDYLPSVAEIKRRHRLLTRDLSIPTAETAWEEVRRSFGRVDRKPWSHPFIEEAVNVIGYRELCVSENQGNDMVRFLRIYANLVERDGQINRLTPTARQLAESSSGVQSIASVIKALPLGGDHAN